MNSYSHSFGGKNFAGKVFYNASIYGQIYQSHGNRGVFAQYSYCGLIRSYFLMTLCGGGCAEDSTEHLRGELEQVNGFTVCSADTLLPMQKERSADKEAIVSASGITQEWNINDKMNDLMVKLLVYTKQLNPKEGNYVFDYDNQFIPTEKYDSRCSYKHADGYFPGIVSINNYPVYSENRNGNSHVKFGQEKSFRVIFMFFLPVSS